MGISAARADFHFLSAEPAPFFKGTDNQMGIYFGQGTGGGSIQPDFWDITPFGWTMFQYSQPATFFRLPARQNIHVGTTMGWGDKDDECWKNYSWPQAGLSMDAAVMTWNDFYLGGGIGAFMKYERDERQDSRYMFGLKMFVGYGISESWAAEIFTQHFSNGNLSPNNGSYNFFGLALLRNF
jgi:hypothetical protein